MLHSPEQAVVPVFHEPHSFGPAWVGVCAGAGVGALEVLRHHRKILLGSSYVQGRVL